MATVKDKVKLCETSLSDFSIENLNGIPFYKRYSEMETALKKHVPSVNFSQCFAQPNQNETKKVIEWFCYPSSDTPTRLSDVEQTSPIYESAKKQMAQIVEAIQTAITKTENVNERNYLNVALKGITGDNAMTTTYLCDGKVLFGIWGMEPISGRNLEDVIREDVSDRRVFTINYEVTDGGRLGFDSIKRRYGHVLSPNDVPKVEISKGWKFIEWSPRVPQGVKITENITFTAVCKKDDTTADKPSDEEKTDSHTVRFKSEVNGTLQGQTEYQKRDGDKVNNNDIPEVIPDNGYEFIGWDRDPRDFVVHSDTEFTARFHKTSDGKGHAVRFKSEDNGILQGQTEYQKHDGDKVHDNEIPQVVPDNGYEFIGWDKSPHDFVVHSDTEFTARFRKTDSEKIPFWKRFWGWGAGCLNWLLALLLLGLIALLLWYLLGNHNLNFCGCDCTETIVRTTDTIVRIDTVAPEEKLVVLDEGSCGEETQSGGFEGVVKAVNLGRQSGTFRFDYNTYTEPDKITIYNGKQRQGQPVFQYEGGTKADGSDGNKSKQVHFNSPDGYISVVVECQSPTTLWVFTVNCPQN